MTLTLVLRPYGGETLALARHRVLAGVIGMGLEVVLPIWPQALVQTCMAFLMLAYSAYTAPRCTPPSSPRS